MAGGGGSDARWLITYGDMVTLLLAFFIALYGISRNDEVKFQQLLTGLGPFNNPAAGQGGPVHSGTGVVQAGSLVGTQSSSEIAATQQDAAHNSLEQPEPLPAGGAGSGAGSGTGGEAHLATRSELPAIKEQLEHVVEQAHLQENVSLRIDQRGLVVTVTTDGVLFQSGSAAVSPEGRGIVGALAPTIGSLRNLVFVEGHTDNVPLDRGGYDNWNLSADRGLAILKLLWREFGIDPRRLVAIGYGEFRPRAPNDSPRGRALNRRVELAITTSGGGDGVER